MQQRSIPHGGGLRYPYTTESKVPIHERLFKEHEVLTKAREDLFNPDLKEQRDLDENCTFKPSIAESQRGLKYNEEGGKENNSILAQQQHLMKRSPEQFIQDMMA
jgi:hypothetical protein